MNLKHITRLMNAQSAVSGSSNELLTQYAQGIALDFSSKDAEFLAPSVPVPSPTGRFKRFDKDHPFKVYDTARAFGGQANRVVWDATDGTYNCKPQALEIGVDDAERSDSGAGINLDEAKVKTLLNATMLAHEKKVADLALTVTAESGKGVWSSDSVDPVDQLDEQIQAIQLAIGVMPNRILMGVSAWRAFKQHSKVIARFPGAPMVAITVGQAAGLLLNPAIEIRVSTLVADTKKLGDNKAKASVIGSNVFVFYNAPAPDLLDASFAKVFSHDSVGSVQAVRTYRDDRARSDMHAVDWSEDLQITNSEAVKRLTIS